ncbi:bleomycin hydrolase [Crepidotus variabilis]|uniref:Cysteine proteinase 1, mitochondrial n=1 Tax=Crepidotus variabilis TaxID=179855 RepID=A0A9P6JP93_9AGAR|nr:bleomycin hydrolase [Crepidotus variabilis]
MGNQPSSRIPTPTASSFDEKDTFVNVSDSISTLSVTSPLSSDGSLTLSHVASWEASANADPKVKLVRTVLYQSDIRSVLASRSAKIADQQVFNHALDFKTGPVTNQKSSGRCWLFATTNVLRYNIMKRLKLKEFQFSQSYLFFWDKLNKSNYYLELMIQHADLPIDDRLVTHLSGDLISDGGQWDMVVNLIENYGLVPQTVYPESTHSSLSSPLNWLLKTKLREHALALRSMAETLRGAHVREETVMATLRAKKEELMKEIYNIMTATLGVPPHPNKRMVWEYIDTDEKVGRWEGSPKDFFEQFNSKPYSPLDSFSLINDPRNEYSKLYTVDKLGNVWGGRPVLYVNTESENLKATVVKLIKAGQPVFFGCDVGKFSDKTTGIMDTTLFDYENAFDISLTLSKADRLKTSDSAMTHAMVITAVHVDLNTGKPVRYRVENSWGEDAGEKGFFVMTDAWFDEFVYQVVVPKALAPKELLQVYEGGDAVVLPPWDPMGALA